MTPLSRDASVTGIGPRWGEASASDDVELLADAALQGNVVEGAGDDGPQDELNRVTKVGEHFGEPYCHQGNMLDTEFGWGCNCREFTPPIALTGPHSAGSVSTRMARLSAEMICSGRVMRSK